MPRATKKNKHKSTDYETIELRFRPAQFRRVKQAAAIKGISVSDFIAYGVSITEAYAIKIIEAAAAKS
jgi:uncharacterized protein (DUF1778 family)